MCVALPFRYNGPNLVLKYDPINKKLVNIAIDDTESPYYALRDPNGNAIGVTACDVDGDGLEEIYFLNTNNAYSGSSLTTPQECKTVLYHCYYLTYFLT